MKKLLVTLGLLGLSLVAVWGALSVDRCGAWPPKVPALTQVSQSQGDLRVGAARVELAMRFPTTVGGYAPLRSTASRAATPLMARAVVLEVGAQKLGLVLLDALLIPPQLRDAIAADQPAATWVLATHTHSGPSGYDPRLASELAALGTFHPDDEQVLVKAARKALAEAYAQLTPAKLELGEALSEGVSVPRSGSEVDRRVTRLRFDGAAGPLAQLLVISAHPTLVPMRTDALSPDWPGLLAERLEKDGGPVTLVLQGAAGNASVNRDALPTPEAVAEKLDAFVRAIPTAPQPEPVVAAWSEVRVALPRPDSRRLAPAALTALADNALCDDAEDVAFLHGLKLGEARLLFAPFEPSLPAGLVLEEQAGATRLVSLADGYAGYLETEAAARANEGEAHRQYFPPELLTTLADGARLVGEAFRAPPQR